MEISPSLVKYLRRTVKEQCDPTLSSRLGSLIEPILALEGMDVRRLKGGIVGFFVGRRELAHIHPEGRIDLPLPLKSGRTSSFAEWLTTIRSMMTTAGTSIRWTSQWGRRSGSFAWPICYEVSRRGEHDPITQEEMTEFTATERCVAAMRASARRWEPSGGVLTGKAS